ncbi:uncharacterized protein LOC133331524 [Musca vetustissima]|uniref:uncharacterized protein LOC133331524 n=1 Tax=Musca vetustissima TaxID=27455 RepID=UPI002AB6D653|nr:uncharacterized protein LOC133331524 [Musca vetustissima]
MVWMETYLLYCSVRLGALVTATLGFVSCFLIGLSLIIFGLDVFNPILKIFNDDEHFRHHFVVKKITTMVDEDSEKLLIIFHLYLFGHMISSVLAFYGAWKIKKYFLIPLAIFEFVRVLYCLAIHILLMTVCKNKLNLGILITATLGGGFVILYLGYNWATLVALYQIVNLINSERYKSVYGDDPFHPLIPKTYNPAVTENVRVLVTPSSIDIDEQKQRNAMQPGIINVLPSNRAVLPRSQTNRNWMTSKWASQSKKPLIVAPAPMKNNDAAYEEAYNYWQWSELTPAVTERNKRNIYASNWKY